MRVTAISIEMLVLLFIWLGIGILAFLFLFQTYNKGRYTPALTTSIFLGFFGLTFALLSSGDFSFPLIESLLPSSTSFVFWALSICFYSGLFFLL